ncbi:hypothetical protein FHW23_001462 [Curtobacterium pusillum]|uniref:Uncharacterized protein n=1 Tax=Curtobacterium pusillum TaxID=69373 RepID=A0AAW3T4R8_9MICO|nr:hypothetical protein [Curtobacterium pusillum]MBA8990216.1 hypothetical protein [Curtobacterium pusillum]
MLNFAAARFGNRVTIDLGASPDSTFSALGRELKSMWGATEVHVSFRHDETPRAL